MNFKINEMPKVALGTWMITNPESVAAVVPAALENGYKHIDTAQLYFNEEMIGEALSKLDIAREEYWITTKVWVHNFRYHTYESVQKSLERLQTTYIDTMLLHAMAEEKDVLTAYKELMRAREDKLIRTIGVSNFSVEMLEAIKKETGEYPKYNQIINSVKQRMPILEKFCKDNGIELMGYSAIRPYYNPNNYYPDAALSDEEKAVVDKIADKHNSSPALVLTRWSMNHGYVVLPKSEKAERVIGNFKVTELNLDDEDMKTLDSLTTFDDSKWAATMNEWKNMIPNDETYKLGVRISPESDKAFMEAANR